MTMAEDVQEDTTEDVAPDTVLEDAGTDKAAVVKDAVTEDKAATKETKTLLSDDEGDGSDKVSTEDYVYTPPEGSELSEEAQRRIDAFKDTAAEMKLNPEQFQSLIDFDVQRSKDALLQQANAYIERIEGWAEQTKADKEFGGEKLAANLGAIRAVTDAYADDSFKALIGAPSVNNPDGLGLGNNPAFLRFLHKVSKSLTDAELIEGSGSGPSTDDKAGLARMYPTMFKNAS
jgi:hypothetical protein